MLQHENYVKWATFVSFLNRRRLLWRLFCTDHQTRSCLQLFSFQIWSGYRYPWLHIRHWWYLREAESFSKKILHTGSRSNLQIDCRQNYRSASQSDMVLFWPGKWSAIREIPQHLHHLNNLCHLTNNPMFQYWYDVELGTWSWWRSWVQTHPWSICRHGFREGGVIKTAHCLGWTTNERNGENMVAEAWDSIMLQKLKVHRAH